MRNFLNTALGYLFVFHIIGWTLSTSLFSWEFQNKNSWVASSLFADYAGFIKGSIWEYYLIKHFLYDEKTDMATAENKKDGVVLSRMELDNGSVDVVDRGAFISIEAYDQNYNLVYAAFDMEKDGAISVCKKAGGTDCDEIALIFMDKTYRSYTEAAQNNVPIQN